MSSLASPGSIPGTWTASRFEPSRVISVSATPKAFTRRSKMSLTPSIASSTSVPAGTSASSSR